MFSYFDWYLIRALHVCTHLFCFYFCLLTWLKNIRSHCIISRFHALILNISLPCFNLEFDTEPSWIESTRSILISRYVDAWRKFSFFKNLSCDYVKYTWIALCYDYLIVTCCPWYMCCISDDTNNPLSISPRKHHSTVSELNMQIATKEAHIKRLEVRIPL